MEHTNDKKDVVCDIKDWMNVAGSTDKIICKVHGCIFPISTRCPMRFPLETTNGLQARESVDKSQGGVDALRPLVDPASRVLVDSRTRIVDLHEDGVRNVDIARALGVSKQYVSKVLKAFNSPEYERFHNFGLKFRAVVDFDAVHGDVVQLRNNVSYKMLYFDLAYVKVFRPSISIIFNESTNIRGLPAVQAQEKAFEIVHGIVAQLPAAIQVLDDVREIISRHNAFVGDKVAEKFYKDYGRHMNVSVDGETRLISDASHGTTEFEAIHKTYAVADSTRIEDLKADYAAGNTPMEKVYEDVISKPSDLPSVQTAKINEVRGEFVNAVRTFKEVTDKYAEQNAYNDANIVKHFGVLDKIGSAVDKLSEKVELLPDVVASAVAQRISPGRPRERSFKPPKLRESLASRNVTSPSVHKYRILRRRNA